MRRNPQQPDQRRILVLGTLTSQSGAPIAALRLASGLQDLNYDVRALFLYSRGGVEAGDFESRALLPAPPRGPGDFIRMVWRLGGEIARFKPHGIVTFLPLASIAGCALGWLLGVEARIVSHRVPRTTYSPLLRRMDTLLAWLGGYTDVVAVSASVANSCHSYPSWLRRRVRVIYNGLKGWRSSSLSRVEARARLGLPQAAFVVASVGRIDPQKNYSVLIRALRDAPAHVIVSVAGDGVERAEIEAQIAADGLERRVRLFGNLPRGEIPHLLAAADIFAQPSLYEGQSNALLEALAAGLPCFVSEAPEQAETISGPEGVAGAILPTHEAAAWGKAISDACSQNDFREQLAPAVDRQARRFTFERMMADFDTVITQRLASVRRAPAPGNEKQPLRARAGNDADGQVPADR